MEKFKSSEANMLALCIQNLNLSFERFFMLVYSFSNEKTHIQTTLKRESCDFILHSTDPTQEAWKPKFWPADFTFHNMSSVLYICPKLVNLS